ncbi:zinc finger protein 90-like [Phlebotomus papatasi]|uniref:zinc finger protein 90-like n=1 Tax=Phlebotomus papatasi TaxID=29031 RepID=UPI002484725E|nr:zinc finger protein 90-like [Phlebotomus papatasi]
MSEWTVCRLCLQSNQNSMKCLMDLTHNSIPFCNIFFELVGTTFTDYSAFPGFICPSCEDHMIQAYNFRNKCIEIEEKLKELFSDGSEVISIDFITVAKEVETEEKKSDVEIKVEPEDSTSDNQADVSAEIEPEEQSSKPQKPPKPKRSIYELSEKDLVEFELKIIQCKKCEERFRGVKKFKNHPCVSSDLSVKNNEEDEGDKVSIEQEEKSKEIRKKSYKCDQCDKFYTNRNTLALHKDKHTNLMRYACVYCDKKFRCWVSRRTHIFKFHLKKSYCYCNHCGKGFNTHNEMNNHILLRHSSEDMVQSVSYQCEKCGSVFKNLEKLSEHLRHQHGRKVKCEICGKFLKNRKSYNVHKKIHLDEKNYVCPVCSEGFTWNASMKNHVRTNHPNHVHLLPPSGTIVSKNFLKNRIIFDNK